MNTETVHSIDASSLRSLSAGTNMRPLPDDKHLRSLPDDELLHRLTELVTQDRRVEADLVAHIGEVDERRLFARLAFPSMHAYCTRVLHLSEAEAYRRITVARAARRYEGLLDWLRDGRIHLTGMALIVPLLKPENRLAVLARATHKSKREILMLVAELSPRPDVPATLRKLPERRTTPVALRGQQSSSNGRAELFPETVDRGPNLQLAPGTVVAQPAGTRSSNLTNQEPDRGPHHTASDTAPEELYPEPVVEAGPLARPKLQSRSAMIEPLSPARYKVQFTVSQELRDKIERLTALMRSEVPDGDLAAIIERAVSEKLARLEARRFGKTGAPRKTLAETVTPPGLRNVPAALRRAVYERDQGRCRFVDEQGRRCTERHRLEFHHHFPFGKGGDKGLVNIRLLCEQHNRYLEEIDYGKATVQAKVEQSRSRREPTARRSEAPAR